MINGPSSNLNLLFRLITEGLRLTQSSTNATFERCRFSENGAAQSSAALKITAPNSAVQFTDCSFSRHRAVYGMVLLS